MATAYLPRAADRAIERGLAQSGCVRFLGPRGIGKTRTAQRHAAQSFDMSSESDRDWVSENAAEVLGRGPYPILIDEWQQHPDVLGDVGRVLDKTAANGLFIVAGSPTWPATDPVEGQSPLVERTVDVEVTPMSVSEQRGVGGPTFLQLLFDGQGALTNRFACDGQLGAGGGDVETVGFETVGNGIFELLDLARASGYPDLIGRGSEEQRSALGALVNAVTKTALPRSVNGDKLRTFLAVSALHSSQPVALAKLMRHVNVARKTAEGYVAIATRLGLMYSVGRWNGTEPIDPGRRSRRFFADPGLCAHLASRLTPGLQRDSRFRSALMLTFVAAQLRAEAGTSGSRFRLRYFRDEQGEPGEVDLVVLDAFTDSVACIDVKARSSVNRSHAANIARVRDTLCGPANNGPRFAGGVVLHAGSRAGRLGSDDIVCLPMSALWSV